MGQLGFRRTDFNETLYLSFLGLSVKKIQVPLKSDKNNKTLHEDVFTFMTIPVPEFFLE
jgi:hypothetical protein